MAFDLIVGLYYFSSSCFYIFDSPYAYPTVTVRDGVFFECQCPRRRRIIWFGNGIGKLEFRISRRDLYLLTACDVPMVNGLELGIVIMKR